MSSAATIPSGTSSDEHSPSGIAPVSAWLRRFRLRRAWLMRARGLARGGLALLAGVACLLLLDAMEILSDPWRSIFTIVIEVTALGVALAFGLIKPWMRAPMTQVARDVEESYPALREQLLACVELSSVRDEDCNFSEDFLAVLQGRVARTLRERSVRDLLPWSMVRGSCLAVLASWLALLGLCFIPDLEMAQRLRRALIPFSHIEQAPRIVIEVIKPARPSMVVPENQAVEFEIQLTGVDADRSTMEWRSTNGGPQSSDRTERMSRIGQYPARYACSLPIATDAIEYRFQVGGHRTDWRTIRPAPRPRIERFKHRVHFPEYTGLPPSELTSDRGALTTLIGARVEVGIEPSLPLESATAIWERMDTGERESLPLGYVDDRALWGFDRECDGDARYQLKLRARLPESDEVIENTFSPTHEWNVVSDHPPAVAWTATEKTLWDAPPQGEKAWIIAPSDLIPLTAHFADDLPGASIEVQIAVNRGSWIEADVDVSIVDDIGARSGRTVPDWLESNAWVPLDGVEQSTRSTANWVWDPMTSGASSGDMIAVRIAVRDSLKQVTYSPVLEFSLASAGFDRNRHQALLARASLVPELERLSSEIRVSKDKLLPRLQLARSGNMPADDRSALAEELRQAETQWSDGARAVRGLAARVVQQLPRPLDQSETEFVVRMISKIEREYASLLEGAAHAVTMEIGQQPRLVERVYESNDHAMLGVQEADDHAQRLVDIYRQFVGHEALTALTKDLLYLKKHEDEQVDRLHKMDFAMLARSQKIAIQYIDTIEQLARKIEPAVSQHLQNASRTWYRNLDQMRLDLNHRIHQEPTSENFAELANEAKRFAETLRQQHWAFNMDGGLWWNITDLRRDLIRRGSGTHLRMQQAVDHLERNQFEMVDPKLDSDLLQQLRALAIHSAELRVRAGASQMADRKELHQQRIPVDSHFASDMSLAIGAWESQFELWAASPAVSRESKIQREIVVRVIQAYRILEVAHEMQDVRVAGETLMRDERYEWESLEGRLAHARIWDSLLHRMEMVHQTMKEIGFPIQTAETFRILTGNETSNILRSKMDLRRKASDDDLVSAAAELEVWVDTLREAERLAQPVVEAARRYLASLTPSLVELARRAAEETRTLEEQSKTTMENTTSPKDMEQQWETTQRSIDRLQNALLENAMQQDILDPGQLEIAKDSDRARQWLQTLRPPMQSATESLLRAQKAAEDAAEMATAISQAQQSQDQMASALETLEKHFSLLEQRAADPSSESNPQIQESRDRLHEQTQRDRQPLKSYDQADRLSEMARLDPEALLRELEQELERNEPMQRELSQLSQHAATDAVAQLKNAANEERSIASSIENADVARRGAKELQTQKLRYLADTTDRIAVSLLEKSSQVVQRMNLPETRRSIHEVIEALRVSAQEARNTNSLQPALELEDRWRSLLAANEAAQQKLDALKPNIQNKIEQAVSKNDQQREGQLTEMRSWQSLMRDDALQRAKDQSRDLQQMSEGIRKHAEQKNQELQKTLQDRQRVMDEFRLHPDRVGLRGEIVRQTIVAAQASAELEHSARLADSAQDLAKESTDRATAIANAPRANLDHPNPIASLAEEQLDAAAKELLGLQQAMRNATEALASLQEPAPTALALSQAVERQNRIGRTVDQIVDQLARSARHEERLKNSEGSKTLEEQSQAIQDAGKQQVAQAQRELSQAAEKAQRSELEHAWRSRSAATPTSPPAQSAGVAQQQTDEAAQALSQLAQSLEQSVAPKSDSGETASRGSPGKSQDSSSGLHTPKEMARMLDLLDQQLRAMASPAQARSSQADPAQTPPAAPQSQPSKEPPSGRGSRSAAASQAKGDSRKDSGPSDGNGSAKALRESADRIAAQLQRERMTRDRQQSESASASSNTSTTASTERPDDQGRSENPPVGDSRLPSLPTLSGQDWGRLRGQRAEEVTQGRRDAVDPEYSDAIRAYFRALGEQR
ncbi:MAG: hypothetical protein ACK6DC_20760 [Planctomycetota bacterium]